MDIKTKASIKYIDEDNNIVYYVKRHNKFIVEKQPKQQNLTKINEIVKEYDKTKQTIAETFKKLTNNTKLNDAVKEKIRNYLKELVENKMNLELTIKYIR